MKNKKAFLLAEETLKIVIALLCIGFLIYFLSALYFNTRDNQDLKLADASLNHLIDGLNSKASEVDIYNPDGWYIASWPDGNVIPDACKNLRWTNCICIFDKSVSTFTINGFAQDSSTGKCVELNNKVSIENTPGEQSPIKISLTKDGAPLKLKITYGSEIKITT